eukprot:m.30578 g.30578  ORF g.30578 m.30578 type:complete len:66 (-) comp6816_c0_seq2:1175-1372(-)
MKFTMQGRPAPSGWDDPARSRHGDGGYVDGDDLVAVDDSAYADPALHGTPTCTTTISASHRPSNP